MLIKLLKNVPKLLLAVSFLTTMPFSVAAKEPEKAPIDYVALGDSLASGMTPTGQDGPNDWGYPEYLQARFEKSHYPISLNNFGVSGYTSSELALSVLNDSNIRQKITNSELITIDIGANDIFTALVFNTDPALAVLNVQSNLNTVLKTIKQLNSKTKVYVMGYYNLLPYAPVDQQASFMTLLHNLNGVIQSDTITNGYTYVPTEKVIAKNYEVNLPNTQSAHLSLEGYQVVEKEFWKAIDDVE